MVISDLVVLACVVYGTQFAWFGLGHVAVSIREDSRLSDLSYWVFSTALIAVWMWALTLADSRSHRIIGTGSTEYVRIADASLRLFGAIAIFAFLFRVDIARGFLLLSLPIGVLVLIIERYVWRQWLTRKRRTGAYSARVLLVGSAESVAQTFRELADTPSAGYYVVGACVPAADIGTRLSGTSLPVLGSIDSVEHALARSRADTVAVTSTEDLPSDKIKQISWLLEAGRQHLVLAPGITDIAGPRIHMRPVSGLSLIHVETPRFSTGQRFAKRAFDTFAAVVLIILLSPVLALVALAVKATSAGPVFFLHERIGLNGRPFTMLKFRSMRVGAHDELEGLLHAQGTATQPLFKVTDDPRITRVGHFIRRFSLDELPQLFNVCGGSMSLVGPRPQVAAEVALYSEAAKRRLLARPGITGLWQVSGRSSLDWEKSVRLDLYYVENWSLLGDLVILVKTLKAVVLPGQTAH